MIFRTLLITSAFLALTAAEAAANGSRGQGAMIPTRTVTTKTTSYAYTTRMTAQPARNAAPASMLGLTRYKIGDTVWMDDGPSLWEEIQDLSNPAPPGFRYIHEDHVTLVVDRNRRVVDIIKKN